MEFGKVITVVSTLLIVVFVQQAISQDDVSTRGYPKGFNVRFRSVQVEAGTLLLINTVNAACDIDVVDLGSGFAAGVRAGIQHTSKKSFSFGGGSTVVGSPYTDVDFLLRLSSSDGSLTEDVVFGYTYHWGSIRSPQVYDASAKFKFGGEVKWLLFKPVGGFFLEANSTIGGDTKPVTVLAVGIVIGIGL